MKYGLAQSGGSALLGIVAVLYLYYANNSICFNGENIMKKLIKTTSICLLLIGGLCQAQDWSEEQAEIWGVVLGSYADADKKDVNWSDKWVSENALVWSSAYPMPRTRDSIKRWDTYQFPLSDNKVSEYSPTGIVVHGSTAVAHYYYSSAAVNNEGKNKTTHGRCTDVMVKEKDGWKFITWNCADLPSKD